MPIHRTIIAQIYPEGAHIQIRMKKLRVEDDGSVTDLGYHRTPTQTKRNTSKN